MRRLITKYNVKENNELAEKLNDFDSFIDDNNDDEGEDDLMAMYDDLMEDDKDNDVLNIRRSKTAADKQEKKKEIRNPFLSYGAGIYNYFVLQERLMCLLFTLSLLTIPQMLIYNFFDGYNYTTGEPGQAGISFGSMGYSGNSCGMNFIDWRQ